MIKLSKVFSREKPLFYLCVWNDSDRMGWRDFVGHEVRNNLYLFPGSGQKSSIWYEPAELDEIDRVLKTKLINQSDSVIDFLKSRLTTEWKEIEPYFLGTKTMNSIDDFSSYFSHLVAWWSAMNTAFGIPDMQEVDNEVRKYFLEVRQYSEKFTEKMSELMVDYWTEHFPQYAELKNVLTPVEAVRLAKNLVGQDEIETLYKRLQGFGMFNKHLYLIDELREILKTSGIELDDMGEFGNAKEIRGRTAFAGIVRGVVRLLKSFADLEGFPEGAVLVTEMTNPDYLSAIHKASAIVTDEGGITCHAAIVSREFKKSCIIGTKIATKVLKDGDEVEVDADKGVVKILKRAS